MLVWKARCKLGAYAALGHTHQATVHFLCFALYQVPGLIGKTKGAVSKDSPEKEQE
jgi:hypothetical protein